MSVNVVLHERVVFICSIKVQQKLKVKKEVTKMSTYTKCQ